jgi:Family of unknown function (DUF6527)
MTADTCTNQPVRVLVVATFDEWRAWLDAVPKVPDENPHFSRVRHIAATGETVMRITGDQLTWVCPGCGMASSGTLGDEPVSGWDEPRWVNSGTMERPTLMPSLGCPTWRSGDCPGHWFLRDGELVPA